MDAYADALGIAADAPRNGASEADQLRSQVSGPMGADPAALTREIQAVQADLQKPLDASSRNLLQGHLSDLRQQQTRISAPAGRDSYADALGLTPGAAPAPAAPAPAPAPAAPQQRSTLALGDGQTLTPPDVKGAGEAVRNVAANAVTGFGANVVGGYQGISRTLSSLLHGRSLSDAAQDGGDAVREYVAGHTYTPDAGTAGAKGVASFSSPANPVNMPAQALDWAGGKVTDATGSPALGAAVNAGGTAALTLLGLRGRAATAPVEVGPAKPGVGVYRPLQIADNPSASVFQPRVTPPAAPVAAGAVAPVAAPAAQPVPTTPEAVRAVAEKTPSALFPETPTTSPAGKFAPDEQVARAKVLESVGMDTSKLRRSAVAGDGVGGSTDFQTAKLDSPAGREMRAVLDNEKNTLGNHADSLVADTGGTHGIDQSALYARGNTILAPLDAMKQWFDSRTSALYKAADERAQGVPTTLSNFSTVLGDASELTNSDRVHLQGAVNAYIKKLGMAGEDGSVAGSAQQAETIRKYLNEQWSPQNSKMVGKLKDALDEDVTSTAGEDIYGEARKIRALRAQTLDNPNGIAKLMDSSGPEGVNRAVPVEKVADSLTGMPVDQFSHVVKTLREAPPELQDQAGAALAEVKAQFANKVHAIGSSQQGQWNAKGVTKYLQNNAARMAQVFTPEEIAKFRNLNDAGHIVAKDQSYPGAAVQGHNLVTHGVMSGLPTAGAAAGGFIGGPVGAAVGGAAGRMAAGAVENAATMRAVRKRTVPLSELLNVGRRQ